MESVPATPGLAHAAIELPRRAKMEILFGILIALFLGALDQTIVGVALPTIVTELRGNDLYTWAITIYLLTATITGPFYGKLSDLYGRKPLLIAGITIFLAGSALSGLSQDIYQLILFRGVQGIGAGALFPIALAVIGDLFTPAERGKYQGLFGAVFGIASILGPLLGGFLTESISWHWIFYVNIPIGLVSLYLIWRLLPTVKRSGASRNLDYAGAFVFTIAISLLLIGLTNKQTADWATPEVGGLLAASFVGILLFLFVESRAAEPIVPLSLFRNRTYAASIATTFFAAFGFFALIIWLPLWFQFVKGATPTTAGLYVLALLLGLIVSSVGSGQLVARTGRYRALTLGAILVTAAGLLLLTNLRADTPIELVWLWMFIGGLGVGPTLAVFTIIVQNAVPFDKLGVATSNLTFFRQVGGSVALAVTGTVLTAATRDAAPGQLTAAGVPPQLVAGFEQFGGGLSFQPEVGRDLGTSILEGAGPARALIEPWIDQIVDGIHGAFSLGVAQTFWWGIAATLVSFAFALLIRELPLRSQFGPRPSSGSPAPHAAGELAGAPAAD